MDNNSKCPSCKTAWTEHRGVIAICAENEQLVKILQDKKFDAGHLNCVLDYCPICQIKELKSQLRDRNYLLLAAKLAFLPNESDFSDDAFAKEILKQFQPQK